MEMTSKTNILSRAFHFLEHFFVSLGDYTKSVKFAYAIFSGGRFLSLSESTIVVNNSKSSDSR